MRKLFTIHKNDRKVLIALLVLLTAACTVLWLNRAPETTVTRTPTPMSRTTTKNGRIDKTDRFHDQYAERPIDEGTPMKPVKLVAFDPNTADSTTLLSLGLQRWQVRNIYRYRRAGGIYRHKEDFARLYGLTAGQYRQLEPYIRIGADYQPAVTLTDRRQTDNTPPTPRYPVKLSEGEQIVLNTADTTELKRVPGIGPYYAKKIVKYGQRLGGYVSIDQLDEIEGFPAEAKRYLTIDGTQPLKLNVNRLTINELRQHPYINYFQARAIVDYRRVCGTLTNLREQLSLSKDFSPDDFSRLEPYVEY